MCIWDVPYLCLCMIFIKSQYDVMTALHCSCWTVSGRRNYFENRAKYPTCNWKLVAALLGSISSPLSRSISMYLVQFNAPYGMDVRMSRHVTSHPIYFELDQTTNLSPWRLESIQAQIISPAYWTHSAVHVHLHTSPAHPLWMACCKEENTKLAKFQLKKYQHSNSHHQSNELKSVRLWSTGMVIIVVILVWNQFKTFQTLSFSHVFWIRTRILSKAFCNQPLHTDTIMKVCDERLLRIAVRVAPSRSLHFKSLVKSLRCIAHVFDACGLR